VLSRVVVERKYLEPLVDEEECGQQVLLVQKRQAFDPRLGVLVRRPRPRGRVSASEGVASEL
jgi:hypothetical protein